MVHVYLIVAWILSLFVYKLPNEKIRSSLRIGFFILFVLAMLREGFGNDYYSYEKIFIDAHKDINSANIEIGFFELNKIFPNYHLLLASLAFVFLFATYRLIVTNVNVRYQWISMFIFIFNPYLFLMSLSSLRQILVISFFVIILSVEYKSKVSKIVLSFVCLLLCTQFHQTAWLLIPVCVYFYLDKTKNVVRLERLFFIITPIILIVFNDLFNSLIFYVIGLFSNNFNYLHHISISEPNTLRATLLTLIYYVYVLINLNKLEGSAYRYSRLYLIGLMFAILAFRYNMFTRFQMYFDLFSIVSLPSIFQLCREKSEGVSKVINVYIFPGLILIIYLLRYYSFFSNVLWESFFEYNSIL